MKILSIDYGTKKTGLSLSSGNLAMPWKILRNLSDNELILQIDRIVKLENIDRIVVGLPIGLNNKNTAQTNKVIEFINNLQMRIKVKVDVFDEKFSTRQAKMQGLKGDDDARAAANILQSYLDKLDIQSSN